MTEVERKYPDRRAVSMRKETHERLVKELKIGETWDEMFNRILSEREGCLQLLSQQGVGVIADD